VAKAWFDSKNVLITGASSGIGLMLAKQLIVDHGCNVFGVGRNEKKLANAREFISKSINEETIKNKSVGFGSFEYLSVDLSTMDNWQKLKEHLMNIDFQVDILINNAGVFIPFEKFETQDFEQCKKLFETNFYSQIYGTKTFLDNIEQVGGGILNISSSSALCPVVGTAMYSASKSAIKGFTEALAIEMKGKMFVGVIFPGFTKTELFRNQDNMSKFMYNISSDADKVAKKIIRALRKKKMRTVIGFDAHLMNIFYRIMPKTTMKILAKVLKSKGGTAFNKVFDKSNNKKRG